MTVSMEEARRRTLVLMLEAGDRPTRASTMGYVAYPVSADRATRKRSPQASALIAGKLIHGLCKDGLIAYNSRGSGYTLTWKGREAVSRIAPTSNEDPSPRNPHVLP